MREGFCDDSASASGGSGCPPARWTRLGATASAQLRSITGGGISHLWGVDAAGRAVYCLKPCADGSWTPLPGSQATDETFTNHNGSQALSAETAYRLGLRLQGSFGNNDNDVYAECTGTRVRTEGVASTGDNSFDLE